MVLFVPSDKRNAVVCFFYFLLWFCLSPMTKACTCTPTAVQKRGGGQQTVGGGCIDIGGGAMQGVYNYNYFVREDTQNHDATESSRVGIKRLQINRCPAIFLKGDNQNHDR